LNFLKIQSFLKVFLFLSFFLHSKSVKSQALQALCTHTLTHSPEEQAQQNYRNKNTLRLRDISVKVLVVYRNTISRAITFNTSTAVNILNSCAAATTGCTVNFNFTELSTNIDWSSSNNGSTNLSALNSRANTEGWYSSYDIVLGISDVNYVGLAGIAYIGNCNNNTSSMGHAIVMDYNTYDAILAHELGHTLGLSHDNSASDIADHSKSLMSSTVPFNNNSLTMSTANKNCYRTSAGCTILPIELLTFEGQFRNGKSKLLWETTSEINNKGFYIERSSDAVNFETVGFVKGKGNTNVQQEYIFIDELKNTYTSILYYRLRQEDFDGTNTYSKIITIESNRQEITEVKVIPNPTHGNVSIEFYSDQAGESQLQLIDILGNIITEKKVIYLEGTTSVHFELSDVAIGLYFIRKIDNNKQSILKVIKY
jgi:hypothetical protein